MTVPDTPTQGGSSVRYPTLKLGSRGPAVQAAKIAYNRWNAKPANTSRVFGLLFRQRIKAFQRAFSIPQTGVIGQRTWKALQPYLTDEARRLLGGRVVPELGPVVVGGKSLLDQDLTHATDGIALYPAFDDGFREGLVVLAPEELVVTRASSSRPGDACYADGASGLRYWIGHLQVAPSVGTRIRSGGVVGRTCANDVGGGPHVHWGVNAENLLGAGRQLLHHTDYTHGAPTVRQQLEAWSRT